MKKICLIALCVFLFPFVLKAQQTPTAVMQKAREKCLAITNGKYTLVRKFKYFSRQDTIIQNGEIVFDKTPADALFGLNFWLENKTDSFSRLYNGNNMVTVSHKEQRVTIDTMERSMYSSIHGNIAGGYLRFPYTDTLPMRILGDSAYKVSIDPAYKNNKDTVVVLVILPTDEGKTEGDDWVRWYFDAKSGYPIAKEVKLIDEDGNVQYEHFLVTSYKFNSKENLQWLSSQKWPDNYDLVYKQPYVRPKLLPNDTIAPDWMAETFGGDSIQLSKLGAKLYLVDFWYRSCGPCVQAMPSLQSLSEKFKPKGLQVIGLNPFDYSQKDSEKFKDFITKRNVSYTLAFVNREVPDKQYRVSGYPTFYLISADGKIVHSQVGYSESMEAEIEEMINKYLETH
jgi:thiol-disulfide isomerase/thioredoxin